MPAAHAMPKKQLRKWIPTPGTVRRHRSLRIFGRWVENANLWQLSRHTTAKAFAIGLYCAMLPVPGQMIISVALAIIFTANVPLFFADFYHQPLTMPRFTTPHISWGPGFWEQNCWTLSLRRRGPGLPNRWTRSGSLLVGSQVMGVILGIFGYLLIDSLWRNAIRRQWQARRRRVVNEPASRRSEAKPPAEPVAPPPAPKDHCNDTGCHKILPSNIHGHIRQRVDVGLQESHAQYCSSQLAISGVTAKP